MRGLLRVVPAPAASLDGESSPAIGHPKLTAHTPSPLQPVDPAPKVSVTFRRMEEASCRSGSEGRVAGEEAPERKEEAVRRAPPPASGGEGSVEDAGTTAGEPCAGLPLRGGEEVAGEHSAVGERSGRWRAQPEGAARGRVKHTASCRRRTRRVGRCRPRLPPCRCGGYAPRGGVGVVDLPGKQLVRRPPPLAASPPS
jgi:hypothetical protein